MRLWRALACAPLLLAAAAAALPRVLPQRLHIGALAFVPAYPDGWRNSTLLSGIARIGWEHVAATRLAILEASAWPEFASHEIVLDVVPSEFSEDYATRRALPFMDPSVHEINGSGVRAWLTSFSSTDTQQLEASAGYFRIPVVGDYVSSPRLGDKALYPFVSRVTPSDVVEARGVLSLLRSLGFRTINILYTRAEEFSAAAQAVEALAPEYGVSVRASVLLRESTPEALLSDTDEALERIRADRSYVLLLSLFSDTLASAVVPKLRQKGMFGPPYTLIGQKNWIWDAALVRSEPEVLEGVLGFSVAREPAGYAAFQERWNSQLAAQPETLFNLSNTGLSFTRYDAAKIVLDALARLAALDAVACNATSATLDTPIFAASAPLPGVTGPDAGPNFTCASLRDPRARGSLLLALIRSCNVSGAGGALQFDPNGDLTNSLQLVQYRRGEVRLVTRALPNGELEGSPDVYYDLRPASSFRDRAVLLERRSVAPRSAVAIMLVFTLVLFVLCIVVLVLNVVFRRHPLIRLSSPLMNDVTLGGLLMLLGFNLAVAVYELGDDPSLDTFASGCTLQLWLLALGFTVSFGALFAKTYRVHKIFNAKKLKSTPPQDKRLLMWVAALVFVDFLILALWTAMNPMRAKVSSDVGSEEALNAFTLVHRKLYNCTSSNLSTWAGLLVLYKAILVVVGCWLAWEVRNVTVEAMNDSKFIGFSLFNLIATFIIAAPLYAFIEDPRSKFFVAQISVLSVSGCVLGFLFIPKVLVLRSGKTTEHRERKVEETELEDLKAEKRRLEHQIEELIKNSRRVSLDPAAIDGALRSSLADVKPALSAHDEAKEDDGAADMGSARSPPSEPPPPSPQPQPQPQPPVLPPPAQQQQQQQQQPPPPVSPAAPHTMVSFGGSTSSSNGSSSARSSALLGTASLSVGFPAHRSHHEVHMAAPFLPEEDADPENGSSASRPQRS